jgi:glucosamine--fructose-6-phosphate aminotransferase (isomerizing)
MGASYHACYPAVNELAGRGIASLQVDTAELLHFRRAIVSAGTILTIVSQSGRSAEAVELVSELSEQPARPLMIAITNGLRNAVAERADIAIDTSAGDEAGPSTITFAAALVHLACVGWLLGGDAVETAIERTSGAAAEAACTIEGLLHDPHGWADDLVAQLGHREVIVLLGRGPARAAAEMGALVLKESGVMAEAFESGAFRHGPFELAGTDMAAIVVATEAETRPVDLGLASELVAAGASVLVISPDGEGPQGAHHMAIGPLERAIAPAVSVLPAQLLAWRLSAERGRTPGLFTRATKVTTRE